MYIYIGPIGHTSTGHRIRSQVGSRSHRRDQPRSGQGADRGISQQQTLFRVRKTGGSSNGPYIYIYTHIWLIHHLPIEMRIQEYLDI